MRHEIDKQSMANDIILTIALCISLAIVTIISHLVSLHESDHKLLIFTVLTFIFVKCIYNGIIHALKLKNKYYKGMR